MAAFQDTQALRFAGADDLALISAVIRAETQAFQDDDISAWSDCWVQDERTQDVYVSSTAGLSVINGWAAVSAHMQHTFQNDLGCQMVRFGQDKMRITVSGDTAWAVFDGWNENKDGVVMESFETRILERQSDGWKIVYALFVHQHGDDLGDGVLSVDKGGRIIWASSGALERIKQHPVLTISSGRVRALRLDWDKALQSAILQAGRYHGHFELHKFAEETGGPFSYPAILGETDDGGVAVAHISVRDCVTYIQIDGDGLLDRRLAVARAVFGLSDQQLRIAGHIANGEGLKSAAATLGISVNTARTHLARLYEKTGVSSQTALVRLLLTVG